MEVSQRKSMTSSYDNVLDDFARYVNFAELKYVFVEEGLLQEEDLALDLGVPFRQFSKKEDRLKYLRKIFVNETKVQKFRRCIKKSVEYSSGGHLGHDYIHTLLDTTQPKFAEEHVIRMSQILHERMKRNIHFLINCIKPCALLLEHMFQKRLLTDGEFETLSNRRLKDIEVNEKIFALLVTKGPTAHLLFTLCLLHMFIVTRESCECHRQLLSLLCLDSEDTSELVSPEQPLILIQIPHYLKGKEYHERRYRFEACYHNGNWSALHKEFEKCRASKVPEIIAIGYLELALGWIFQLNEIEVNKYLALALSVITTMKDPIILFARHEYLHSLLLRYQGRYIEASEAAYQAVMFLILFEVGEDKAFAQYCYATSYVETLTPWCTDEEFTKAKKMLTKAIDFAQRAIDMEILVIYAQLQLARLYLGTTDSFLTVTQDQGRIKDAHRCLNELGEKLNRNELQNERFKSLYHLRLSDYKRCLGDMASAEQSALQARDLAEKAGLPIEEKAANNRLELIRQCTYRDTGKKRDYSNSDSEELTPSTKRQCHAREKISD